MSEGEETRPAPGLTSRLVTRFALMVAAGGTFLAWLFVIRELPPSEQAFWWKRLGVFAGIGGVLGLLVGLIGLRIWPLGKSPRAGDRRSRTGWAVALLIGITGALIGASDSPTLQLAMFGGGAAFVLFLGSVMAINLRGLENVSDDRRP